MKKSIRDKFFEERAKEEAKKQAASSKADQNLVKAVIKNKQLSVRRSLKNRHDSRKLPRG